MPRDLDFALLPAQAQKEAGKLVPSETIQIQKFFQQLSETQQTRLMEQTKHLGTAVMVQGTASLAIGKHLADIQETLTKVNGFYKYLKLFKINPKKAYRYMDSYRNAAHALPENILKVAITRGLPIISWDKKKPLGEYTLAVRQFPPPRNPDVVKANDYVDEIEKFTKERKTKLRKAGGKKADMEHEPEMGDPDVLLKSAYRGINLMFKRVPGNTRSKRIWVDKLVGMLLADLGVASAQTFEPTNVPEDFRAVRGRPKLEAEAASA